MMSLNSARGIKKFGRGRFKSPCLVCGKTHGWRIALIFKHSNGYSRRSICWSYAGDRRFYQEFLAEEIMKGVKTKHLLRTYDERFPSCYAFLFKMDFDNEIFVYTGKITKASQLKCVWCGIRAVGGIWCCSSDRIAKAVCLSCLIKMDYSGQLQIMKAEEDKEEIISKL